METQKLLQKETSMTEKDRWQLVGVICSAVGTAIATYFATKK